MIVRLLFSTITVLLSLVVYGQRRPEINKVFSISPTSAQFSSEGGSKIFIVKSNSPWEISTNTKSWGHLEKSGNTLTLSVDTNTAQSSRSDYFELVLGEKSLRVSIFQAGGVLQPDEPTTKVERNTYTYDIVCKRLLTENDVIGLSKKDLRIMRNWIYARHGYIFKRKDLQMYFSKFEWYHAKYTDIPYNLLSDIEQKNIEFIKRYE